MESFSELRRQLALDDLYAQGWLEHIEWRSEVDSTNNLAKEWFKQVDSRTPALFVADQQTAGRGRSGNQWWSPSGCLMLTLAIPTSELPCDATLHPQLALVAGVAVALTADSLLGNPDAQLTQLKWPNDAYIRGRKLSGILIEACQGMRQSVGFAIGIGFNTHVDWQAAPQMLSGRAVCLSSIAGRMIECETVLVELIRQIRLQLAKWRDQPHGWLTEWRDRCLLREGSFVYE